MANKQWELDDAYARGVQDGEDNVYNAPHSTKISTGFGTDDEKELKAAYDRGWEKGKRNR